MFLRSLQLRNFRLYENALFTFSPESNYICGPNAIGKTSLLEAIHFLIAGSSFRNSRATNLIRHGETFFLIEAHFIKHGVEQYLRVTYSKGERRVWLNDTEFPAVASLQGTLCGVVLAPCDLNLIAGAPQERRQYLDNQLSQVDPLYLHHLQRYGRAMRQRNLLLKGKRLSSIESWEWEMATSASYILKKRLQLTKQLQGYCSNIYNAISGGNSAEPFTLAYSPSIKIIEGAQSLSVDTAQNDIRDSYVKQLCSQRPREIAMAMTLYGPHRDDLILSINSKEARYFSSEGQQRSCSATLRLAEWHASCEAASGDAPLMLVDDMNTSLDEKRSQRLLLQLEKLSQLFITAQQSKPSSTERHSKTIALRGCLQSK